MKRRTSACCTSATGIAPSSGMMWQRDAASVGDERRFRLGAFALAQHQALVGGGKVVAAKIGHRHGAACGIAACRWILAVRHACPRALRARWRASSGVSTPTRPKASFRVLPAEFRYWTTHVRTPVGLALRAKPARSSSRYSVSRVTGFSASTNRLVSLGKAASAELTRCYPWPGTHRGHRWGKTRVISCVFRCVLIMP